MATDVSGFDPITVSLRDHFDGANAAHDLVHQREHEVNKGSLEAHDKHARTVVESHFRSHDTEHANVHAEILALAETLRDFRETHKETHARDLKAVETALHAVKELQLLHTANHEREHHSHEQVHQREREAASLARVEQATLFERVNAAIEARDKQADNAHGRMDKTAEDHRAAMQKQIDDLKLVNAAGSGASARTGLLFAASATVITLLLTVAAVVVTLYLGSN